MASLLARMNIDVPSVGPQRSKGKRESTSPYVRAFSQSRPPKGDVNSQWTHDMFADGKPKSLSARMSSTPLGAPKINFNPVDRALKDAAGELSIRGASGSMRRNVVEVTGLVKGTTPADVEAIFKQEGDIVRSVAVSTRDPNGDVAVRLVFKEDAHAQSAVKKFNGQMADGKRLGVRVVGGNNASLSGRMNVSAVEGNVDALVSDVSGGSKMRSDDILSDADARARAHVLLAPPGADPNEYSQARGRGRGGRRRGGGRRGGRGGGGARMDVD
ncbi:hypothetical protein OF83DRAFT_1055310 [Amylostereum chailletii]|nr:hypothetical protein OF83DRAFT_1055310 [Amylostereum chailletii]